MKLAHSIIRERYGPMLGQQFGHFILTEILPDRIHRRVAGRFTCDCGKVRCYPIARVLGGRYKHCGCRTDYAHGRTHGMRFTPEYQAWTGMKLRCMDPNNRDYPKWGGRGVRVHPEWLESFEAFYEHVGPRPQGTTLDRIDTLGHYEPGNVRWASMQTQAENRRNGWSVEIDGVTYPSIEAAGRAHGVSATSVIRWCDGYVDPRRGNTNFIPPRSGCKRWRTYE